jgi:hypothetical protein
MVIYSTPYNILEFETGRSLLTATWQEKSAELNPAEVKLEILNILEFTTKHAARNVLVDARLYPFRENEDIQRWITNSFMPMMMETGVKKYGLIVPVDLYPEQPVEAQTESDDLTVEYFHHPESALRWIDSK